MTSTNDGKDVKSNQTSGQKAKSYYIDLYKSLDARLSGECELSERTQHLCEAWRTVHSLCVHSAHSTHLHLAAWLHRHTANSILQTKWRAPESKNDHTRLKEALDDFEEECRNAATARDAAGPAWEQDLRRRAQWFKGILGDPWGHSVFTALCDPKGKQPTEDEFVEWLKAEQGVMLVTRLRHLASSKCEDVALHLATAVMDRVRACTALVSDADQAEARDEPEAASNEANFLNILKAEADFTKEIRDILMDIEFVLLHKVDNSTRCIELAKQIPLRNSKELVERLSNRLEASPRDKKLWKNAKKVATLIAQVVITRCMVVARCVGHVRAALYECTKALVRLLGAGDLPPAAAALARHALTARHLHTLAQAVRAECKEERKPFVCELYIRAITTGMNELERLKTEKEPNAEAEARLAEKTLCVWFMQLGAVLSDSDRLRCECSLTAFSVHPAATMYDHVKAAPSLAPLAAHEPDKQDSKQETNSEYGSWATDSRSMTNFVKTSETLNIKQTQQQTNVLSTAILSEGETLGLSPELCQDLAVLLSGPRLKTLSWDMDREVLLDNCKTYMERTRGGTRALTAELKYLNLDLSSYQHLPEEEDEDENDMYYGIEKGYEHLVETQPDEIWQDEYSDFDKTDSNFSSESEIPLVIPRRIKKKSRRTEYSTDEEVDPLSFDPEPKRVEKKKERPHSKERSKERKQKSKPKKDTDEPREGSRERSKERKDSQKKEKKKEKKERKKKEKIDTGQKPKTIRTTPGPLSRLVGMKVARAGDSKVKIERTSGFDPNSIPIIDSDYDSQGKYSLTSVNSEGYNSDVLFDGVFSVDEMKSSEKTVIQRSENYKSTLLKPHELTVRNGKISIDKTCYKRTHGVIQNYSATKYDEHSRPSSAASLDRDFLNPENVSYGPHVREDVKDSIKKLLQFRRQKANELLQRSYSRPSTINNPIEQRVVNNQISLEQISPKSITVPDIPKVFINKDQSKQISALQDEIDYVIKHCINKPSNSISNVPQNKNIQDNIQSYQHNVQRKNEHKDVEQFLKELHQTINAGATQEKLVKKESVKSSDAIKSTFIPSILSKQPNPILKQQKKVDNAPHTFSRLSYMHKNKQGEVKSKHSDQFKHGEVVTEFDPRAKDFKISKDLFVSKNLTSTTTDSAFTQTINEHVDGIVNRKKGLPKKVSSTRNLKEYPVLTNMLSSNTPRTYQTKNTVPMASSVVKNMRSPVPATTTFTEKDQNDLLLILRQQNKLNTYIPKTDSNVNKTISSASSSSDLTYSNVNSKQHSTNDLTKVQGPSNKVKAISADISRPTTTQYDLTSKLKVSTLKNNQVVQSTLNKPQTVYQTKPDDIPKNKMSPTNDVTEPQDWKTVMNALAAQRTPNRINRDSFPTKPENDLRSQRLVVKESDKLDVNKKQCVNITNAMHVPVMKNLNITCIPVQNTKKQNQVELPNKAAEKEIPKRLSYDSQKKPLISNLIKQHDPYISGIPNSDYELLGELIDDDLRQEIEEMSDDETYTTQNQGVQKSKTSVDSKNMNRNVFSKSTGTAPSQKQNMLTSFKEKILPSSSFQGNNYSVKQVNSESVSHCINNSSNVLEMPLNPRVTGFTTKSQLHHMSVKKSSDNQTCVKSTSINNNIVIHTPISNTETGTCKAPIIPKTQIISQGTANTVIHKVPNIIPPRKDEHRVNIISNTLVNAPSPLPATNIVMATVPQRTALQNVVVIGSELVYDPYSRIQFQEPQFNATLCQQSAYVAVNATPNITLFQTQFAAPVINPVIIGSDMTHNNITTTDVFNIDQSINTGQINNTFTQEPVHTTLPGTEDKAIKNNSSSDTVLHQVPLSTRATEHKLKQLVNNVEISKDHIKTIPKNINNDAQPSVSNVLHLQVTKADNESNYVKKTSLNCDKDERPKITNEPKDNSIRSKISNVSQVNNEHDVQPRISNDLYVDNSNVQPNTLHVPRLDRVISESNNVKTTSTPIYNDVRSNVINSPYKEAKNSSNRTKITAKRIIGKIESNIPCVSNDHKSQLFVKSDAKEHSTDMNKYRILPSNDLRTPKHLPSDNLPKTSHNTVKNNSEALINTEYKSNEATNKHVLQYKTVEEIIPKTEAKILDMNSNKNSERKVLSEVQEKLILSSEKVDPKNCGRPILETGLRKEGAKDAERLLKKRIAIINRKIHYRSNKGPIALTYTPIKPTEDIEQKKLILDDQILKENEKIKTLSSNNNINLDAIINNEIQNPRVEHDEMMSITTNVPSIENTKENTKEKTSYRRISLRSSSKVKDEFLSLTNEKKTRVVLNRKTKIRLKPSAPADKNKVYKIKEVGIENDSNTVLSLPKALSVQDKSKHKTTMSKKKKKRGEKVTMNKNNVLNTNKNSMSEFHLKNKTASKIDETLAFNSELDVEEQLLGSVIAKGNTENTENSSEAKIKDPKHETNITTNEEIDHPTIELANVEKVSSFDNDSNMPQKDQDEKEIKLTSKIEGHSKNKRKSLHVTSQTNVFPSVNKPLTTSDVSQNQYQEFSAATRINEPSNNDNNARIASSIGTLLNTHSDQTVPDKVVSNASRKKVTTNQSSVNVNNKSTSKRNDASDDDGHFEITEEFKKTIKIEELPRSAGDDPLKRIIRIKLPNSVCFKATISGKLHVNIDYLFADPAIKSVLLSSLPSKRKCTLNIKQICSSDKKDVSFKIKSHSETIGSANTKPQIDKIETVDLISDDEEEVSNAKIGKLSTESVLNTDNDPLARNESLLRNCIVKLIKCDLESKKSQDNSLKNMTRNLNEDDDLIDKSVANTNEAHSGLSENTKIIVDTSSDVIELDDSSNDSVICTEIVSTLDEIKDNTIPTSVQPLPDINVLKDHLFKELMGDINIIEDVTKDKSTQMKVHNEKHMCFSNVIGTVNKSTATEELNINKEEVEFVGVLEDASNEIEDDDIKKEQVYSSELVEQAKMICVLKVPKCDKLVKKYERLKIMNRPCFVKLERCDGLIKLLQKTKESDIDMPDEPEQLRFETEPTLKRSGSLSILNDFSLYTEQTGGAGLENTVNVSNRENHDVVPCGNVTGMRRTGSLSILDDFSVYGQTTYTDDSISSTTMSNNTNFLIKCHSEWNLTKLNLHDLFKRVYSKYSIQSNAPEDTSVCENNDDRTFVTDIENNLCNIPTVVDSKVPSLLKLVLAFFANNLNPETLIIKTPLKRKFETTATTSVRNMLKLENQASCIAMCDDLSLDNNIKSDDIIINTRTSITLKEFESIDDPTSVHQRIANRDKNTYESNNLDATVCTNKRRKIDVKDCHSLSAEFNQDLNEESHNTNPDVLENRKETINLQQNEKLNDKPKSCYLEVDFDKLVIEGSVNENISQYKFVQKSVKINETPKINLPEFSEINECITLNHVDVTGDNICEGIDNLSISVSAEHYKDVTNIPKENTDIVERDSNHGHRDLSAVTNTTRNIETFNDNFENKTIQSITVGNSTEINDSIPLSQNEVQLIGDNNMNEHNTHTPSTNLAKDETTKCEQGIAHNQTCETIINMKTVKDIVENRTIECNEIGTVSTDIKDSYSLNKDVSNELMDVDTYAIKTISVIENESDMESVTHSLVLIEIVKDSKVHDTTENTQIEKSLIASTENTSVDMSPSKNNVYDYNDIPIHNTFSNPNKDHESEMESTNCAVESTENQNYECRSISTIEIIKDTQVGTTESNQMETSFIPSNENKSVDASLNENNASDSNDIKIQNTYTNLDEDHDSEMESTNRAMENTDNQNYQCTSIPTIGIVKDSQVDDTIESDHIETSLITGIENNNVDVIFSENNVSDCIDVNIHKSYPNSDEDHELEMESTNLAVETDNRNNEGTSIATIEIVKNSQVDDTIESYDIKTSFITATENYVDVSLTKNKVSDCIDININNTNADTDNDPKYKIDSTNTVVENTDNQNYECSSISIIEIIKDTQIDTTQISQMETSFIPSRENNAVDSSLNENDDSDCINMNIHNTYTDFDEIHEFEMKLTNSNVENTGNQNYQCTSIPVIETFKDSEVDETIESNQMETSLIVSTEYNSVDVSLKDNNDSDCNDINIDNSCTDLDKAMMNESEIKSTNCAVENTDNQNDESSSIPAIELEYSKVDDTTDSNQMGTSLVALTENNSVDVSLNENSVSCCIDINIYNANNNLAMDHGSEIKTINRFAENTNKNPNHECTSFEATKDMVDDATAGNNDVENSSLNLLTDKDSVVISQHDISDNSLSEYVENKTQMISTLSPTSSINNKTESESSIIPNVNANVTHNEGVEHCTLLADIRKDITEDNDNTECIEIFTLRATVENHGSFGDNYISERVNIHAHTTSTSSAINDEIEKKSNVCILDSSSTHGENCGTINSLETDKDIVVDVRTLEPYETENSALTPSEKKYVMDISQVYSSHVSITSHTEIPTHSVSTNFTMDNDTKIKPNNNAMEFHRQNDKAQPDLKSVTDIKIDTGGNNYGTLIFETSTVERDCMSTSEPGIQSTINTSEDGIILTSAFKNEIKSENMKPKIAKSVKDTIIDSNSTKNNENERFSEVSIDNNGYFAASEEFVGMDKSYKDIESNKDTSCVDTETEEGKEMLANTIIVESTSCHTFCKTSSFTDIVEDDKKDHPTIECNEIQSVSLRISTEIDILDENIAYKGTDIDAYSLTSNSATNTKMEINLDSGNSMSIILPCYKSSEDIEINKSDGKSIIDIEKYKHQIDILKTHLDITATEYDKEDKVVATFKNTEPMDTNADNKCNQEIEQSQKFEKDDVTILCDEDSGILLGNNLCKNLIETCYVFPMLNNIEKGCDVSNSRGEDLVEGLKFEVINTDSTVIHYDVDLQLLIPNKTYSKKNYGLQDTEENNGRRGQKRKIEFVDSKVSKKRYRKGKDIDHPKLPVSASAYSKQFKQLFDYCSTVKFSYSRPFHKEFIDTHELVQSWPIINDIAINDITEHDSHLFRDLECHGKQFFDPKEQTLAEEIARESEGIEPFIQINETNFNMGFGERSGRVIQNLEVGDNEMSKFSAATLSDVKQTQPFLSSENKDFGGFQNVLKTDQNSLENIKRFFSCIDLKTKVRSYFKKTSFELKYSWIMRNSKDYKSDCSNEFPFDYFMDRFEPSPIESIVQVVQVGQLPVSAAAQNPVTCDPRVTQVSDASPSQCAAENSPHDDSQPVIKTEYTELTTADLTLPLVQQYQQQHSQMASMASLVTSMASDDDDDIKSDIKIEVKEEIPDPAAEENTYQGSDIRTLVNKHINNNANYTYESNNVDTSLHTSHIQLMYNSIDKDNDCYPRSNENEYYRQVDQTEFYPPSEQNECYSHGKKNDYYISTQENDYTSTQMNDSYPHPKQNECYSQDEQNTLYSESGLKQRYSRSPENAHYSQSTESYSQATENNCYLQTDQPDRFPSGESKDCYTRLEESECYSQNKQNKCYLRGEENEHYRPTEQNERYRSVEQEECYTQSSERESYQPAEQNESYIQSRESETYQDNEQTECYPQTPSSECYSQEVEQDRYSQAGQKECYPQSDDNSSFGQSERNESFSQSGSRECYSQAPHNESYSATKPIENCSRIEENVSYSPSKNDRYISEQNECYTPSQDECYTANKQNQRYSPVKQDDRYNQVHQSETYNKIEQNETYSPAKQTESYTSTKQDKNYLSSDQSESYSRSKSNGQSEKTDQIAHAMSAAGITTTADSLPDSATQTLVNMLSQKIHANTKPATSNNFPKTTSVTSTMSLQQALAQMLPPPLNQTSVTDNGQQTTTTPVGAQVLHIVQGKGSTGNQITLVDNSQQSVINAPNTTPVLHILQNKTVPVGPNSNATPVQHTNSFSGLSLVDTGLQQGGNQLLQIVNTGNQKNNNTGQILKRVNLLTNLANVQGMNEQKMVQFVCKSADGKSIQLNAPHQRSMVLRLQPIESPNISSTPQKSTEGQEVSPSLSNTVSTKEEIKSRSVFEENYAKFVQNGPTKTIIEKSTSLPKFNQAFGKQVFQDGAQKPNEINNSHGPNTSTNSEIAEGQPSENAINLEHIGQISSPPLLLRKSPAAQPAQTQPNLVQQIKQTISPMNIQTMPGGVIYTRQIPVNIGGGQTINLITVPSSELVDDSGQKQQTDVKFVNQGEIEPSIIKIVPQAQTATNNENTQEEGNSNTNASNENLTPNTNTQPVLTQMRIKLPMLSKTPQVVSGARVVRPSFFQIQRNVIGGTNQPVYQQLVLTAAPPLGQQTIRLPLAQASRQQIKVPTEQSSTEPQMSSSTLEQLREFDMVLEQVKERSTVNPNGNPVNNFQKMSTTDTTDSPTPTTSPSTEPQQHVLYSIGNNQQLNVTYINRKSTVQTAATTNFVRSPDSTEVDSPSSSSQISQTVTSETATSETSTQQNQTKSNKISSKSKSRPKSTSNPPNSLKVNSVPPKTSNQKPLEDEQTTQRILYILAEYKEQVENSPDKDKPAPRRRTNPPSNPGSSKRKKSSSGSRRPGMRDVSPIHGEDTCRTMGSEDSSCGTSQGDCAEGCLESHSPQESPRKVVRRLTFEQESQSQPSPRPMPPRNVIVADGQTITVARGAAGKPATAVLMPANYILPVSMMKGQQIAIVTNRGPRLLTVGDGTNALLLQRLIGPAGLKPVLTRPGVRHVRLPTAALHNLQTFNIAAATTAQPPDSTASPVPGPTPPELVDTRANISPWTERTREEKPDRTSSPEGSEPWNIPSSADPHDYIYEETVRADNMDRTVLDPITGRYSPDMEAQRIFDKMFDVESRKSYIVDSQDDSPRCAYDIDASDCEDKPYHQVVQKRDGTQRRLVSAAALRHKYAILEHELRLQKSLSEECEDLGVDSPSASELFPEAELLFAASPAQDAGHQSQTPQPTMLNQSGIPQPDMDDQIATDQLLTRENVQEEHQDLDMSLGLEDVGIVTVSDDGMQTTIALDQEEFARSHPNTTFHSEPTDDGEELPPFTITGLKGRAITSTIFHAGRAPATVLMAPQTRVISQTVESCGVQNNVKYANIDTIINSQTASHGNNINLSSVLVKDDGLTRFDGILTDSRELHLSNTTSAIVHSTGNATQVIRRVCYEDDRRERDARFLIDDPDALIAGDDAKMVAEDSSRDATLESMTGDVEDDRSSPERHELFWESNSASERSESRRPLDFSSDSDKCCKSPSLDETNSTDSSLGTHMRLDSVIKNARGIERSGSADGSSAEETHPPLRTYPPKRIYHHMEAHERSMSGKTRAGERSPDPEVRRRASGRGVVKRGCHCCNGSPAPPRPKKSRPKKPTLDFTN